MTERRGSSIFTKMLGIFVLIIVAVGATLFATLLVFSARDQKAQDAQMAAKNIETGMLSARRNEKDFQLRDLSLPAFYQSGETDNLTKHRGSMAAMDKAITQLAESHELRHGENFKALQAADAAYEEAFLKLVAAYRSRGFLDWGAEGEFRAAAHGLESRILALKRPALEIGLLTIRRNEKDYLLRHQQTDVEALVANVTRMRSEASGMREPARTDLLDGLDKYGTAFQKYVEMEKVIGLTENDGLQGAMRDAIHKVEPLVPLLIADANAAGAEANRMLVLLTLIVLAAGTGAGILVFSLFARSLANPIRSVARLLATLATGDLTVEVGARYRGRRDEVGVLARALTDMSVRIRGMVATIQDSVEQVAASSEQISSSAQSLAEGAQRQASTLEETSASMQELNASVEQVSGHAQNQAAAVQQGSSSMTQVQRSIDDISRSLTEISGLAAASVENAQEGAESVRKVVQGITLIAEGSEKIGGIVTMISDIADQTNLLALNASIEAARAGEHGRGFAVVADEVSKLADRSSASTKEIEGLIKESVKNVSKGVQIATGSQGAMEQIRTASLKVKEMITALSASMEQQVTAVKELAVALTNVSEMSQSISAATEEQSVNARQISKAVETVNEVTQNAASAAEETSSSTEQLSGMAQELQRLAAQFKIDAEAEQAQAEAVAAARPASPAGLPA
jgi:methyl-accepting chemotaxis protein